MIDLDHDLEEVAAATSKQPRLIHGRQIPESDEHVSESATA